MHLGVARVSIGEFLGKSGYLAVNWTKLAVIKLKLPQIGLYLAKTAPNHLHVPILTLGATRLNSAIIGVFQLELPLYLPILPLNGLITAKSPRIHLSIARVYLCTHRAELCKIG